MKNPEQWSLSARSQRRLVIKEINPLAIELFIKTYQPRIIYLVRHPVAVANSFVKLGWIGKQFENRFSSDRLASSGFDHERFTSSFWSEHGALQAVTMKLALEALGNYPDCKIIKYEDLCANPVEIYRDLYTFAELDWDPKVEESILAQSYAQNNRSDSYSTYQSSQTMIDSWKRDVSEEIIAEVKNAYLAYDPPYYSSQEW